MTTAAMSILVPGDLTTAMQVAAANGHRKR